MKTIETAIDETKSLDYKKATNKGKAKNSRTISRYNTVQGTIFIRCYLQEL